VGGKEKRKRGRPANERPLRVWADRRAEPDWDLYIEALVALALKRVDEEDQQT
jgi:hypothetical protein